MRSEHSETGRHFWWRWMAGCFGGWFLGFLLGFIFAGSFEAIVPSGPVQSALGYMVLGLFVGFGVGFMQWRLLRQNLDGVGMWILASGVGMGIAGGVGYSAAVLIFGYSEGLEGLGSVPAVLGWTMTAAVGGFIAGLLQRRVLTRRGAEAGRWVLFNTLGWALSFAVFGTICAVGYRFLALDGADFFIGLVAGGVLLGAVTAPTASGLFGKQRARSFDQPAHI